jgi:peroxiredoxin
MNGGAASMEFPNTGSRQLGDEPPGDGHLTDRLRERAEGERLEQRLVGRTLPSGLPLTASHKHIESFASRSLVVYLYPGASDSHDGGSDSLMADAAQHRAFRDREAELIALHFSVVGLTSQSQDAQIESALTNRISHTLLSDPRLLLADELELPTVTLAGVRLYRRLTIIARHGRIGKVFFPVVSAHRNADQALAWIKVNG